MEQTITLHICSGLYQQAAKNEINILSNTLYNQGIHRKGVNGRNGISEHSQKNQGIKRATQALH